MSVTQGQLCRRIGLIIEAASILGMLATTRGQIHFGAGLGVDPSVAFASGLAFGFFLWGVGTFFILRGRRREQAQKVAGKTSLLS